MWAGHFAGACGGAFGRFARAFDSRRVATCPPGRAPGATLGAYLDDARGAHVRSLHTDPLKVPERRAARQSRRAVEAIIAAHSDVHKGLHGFFSLDRIDRATAPAESVFIPETCLSGRDAARLAARYRTARRAGSTGARRPFACGRNRRCVVTRGRRRCGRMGSRRISYF